MPHGEGSTGADEEATLREIHRKEGLMVRTRVRIGLAVVLALGVAGAALAQTPRQDVPLVLEFNDNLWSPNCSPLSQRSLDGLEDGRLGRHER